MFENCESWECGAVLVVICNGPTIDWLCFFNQNGAVGKNTTMFMFIVKIYFVDDPSIPLYPCISFKCMFTKHLLSFRCRFHFVCFHQLCFVIPRKFFALHR